MDLAVLLTKAPFTHNNLALNWTTFTYKAFTSNIMTAWYDKNTMVAKVKNLTKNKKSWISLIGGGTQF